MRTGRRAYSQEFTPFPAPSKEVGLGRRPNNSGPTARPHCSLAQRARSPGENASRAEGPKQAVGTQHASRRLLQIFGVEGNLRLLQHPRSGASPHWRFTLLAIVALLLCFCAPSARAEDVSVSATLSTAAVALGESLDLQITVSGAAEAPVPRFNVDGLSIQYLGPSTSIQMNNFTVTRTVILNYTVAPQRAGTFTIPSVELTVAGKKLATRPLTLTVSGQGQAPGQSAPGGQPGVGGQPGAPSSGAEGGQLAYAEWVFPKTSGYVGEAIPVELRFYVDAQVRVELQQMPSAAGDGFTLQRFPQPKQVSAQRNGKEYRLVIFKTALIPVKAGKLTVPPTDVNFVAYLAQRRQRPRNMPRMPGFGDIFDDPFFNITQPQQMKAQAAGVELDIKPLPVAGRPKGFSGAVGDFKLSTKASPVRVKAGDPITVTAVVAGIGSFDRMEAPRIADEPGWRAYPPNGKFKPDDEVGISGTKSFETAVIADGPKDKLPRIEFAYFDPAQAKYVTLTDDSNMITVEGSVAATPAPTAQPSVAAAATPASTPQPKVNDILYIQPDSRHWGASFEPAWRRNNFWIAQLLALAAFLGFAAWRWRQVQLGDRRARRLAGLREAKTETMRAIQQKPLSPAEFYDAVVRYLQLDTALTVEREPETIDAEIACARRDLDSATVNDVRCLFAAHDELRYAGAGGDDGAISPERRETVLRILERFEKSYA